MKSLKCPSCGAPIEFDDDAVVARCGHCGSSVVPTQYLSHGGLGRKGGDRRGQVDVPVVDLSGVRKALSPRRALGCTVLVLVAVFGLGGLIAWRSFSVQKSIRRSIESATNSFTSPAFRNEPERPLPVAKLAEPGFAGHHRIAAAPPPGGLAAMEPVAALPWALAIAQVWSSDVKLERIDVERVRPDGTVNTQDDASAEVTYRFVSPSRFQAFRERANLESDPKGDFEFWVALEKGEISAYEISSHAVFADDDAAEEIRTLTWPKSRPLPQILHGAAARPGFPDVPFYKGYLIHLDREGWCWYLSTLSGSPDIPRIRARDAKPWPY